MLPPEYDQLTDEQRKGEEYIIPGLPALYWVGELAGALSRAETRPALVDTYWPPRSKYQPTWTILQTWKRLSRLGFVPTSRENYSATGNRMVSRPTMEA